MNLNKWTELTEEELMNTEGGLITIATIAGGVAIFLGGRLIGQDLKRKFGQKQTCMKNLKNVMGAVLIIFGVLCILGDLNVITFNVEKYFQTELVVPILILMMSYLDLAKDKV